jgi:glycosyltransferase involved in cell wall biosynthesis
MRVLHISVRADYGGGPEHIYQLVNGLKDNMDCFIACPKDDPYWYRYEELIGPSHLVEIPHRKFSMGYLFVVYKFIRKKSIDVIHSHGKGAGIYGRFLSILTRMPSVHTPHGIHLGQYSLFKRYLYIFYEKFFSMFLNKVIYVSDSERELSHKYKLWPVIKGVVIPNGVNNISYSIEEKKEIRDRLGLNPEDFVVICNSRFDNNKNMKEAYEIAKCFKEILFIWIGDGPEKVALENKAQTEGVSNIKFVGFINNVKDYLISSDIILSTSKGEGMPLALLEGMSAGLPIVATNVVGNKDLVQHGENGYLYTLNSVEEACEYIDNLKRNDIRIPMSKFCKEQHIENYSISKMVEKVKGLYKEVIIK